jgi:CubicO group peptidase (beta-lactamase class C family)
MATIARRILVFTLFILLCLGYRAQAAPLATALEDFEKYAQQSMVAWSVPGMAIAVVKGDTVVYAKGFGTRLIGADEPVNADTVFQVGSTTKAFTVALVASLVDEGRLEWDDRVVDHFPEFMMFDPWVTREFRVHDLFAQRSGMPPYAGDLQSFIGFGREHILRSMRHIEPVYGFRDSFSYVNNLFLAGARVVELTTGNTWEKEMTTRILLPLGMDRSTLDGKSLTQAKNTSSLHVLVRGEPQPILHASPLYGWPYTYGPAGGLNSNALDMARWVAVQLKGGALGQTRIFSQEAAEYMHTPKTFVKSGEFQSAYCQGWMKTDLEKVSMIWHNGGTSGACSFVGFAPGLDLGLVVLTNLGGHKLADALGFQFFEMMSGDHGRDWSHFFLQETAAAEQAQVEEKTGRTPQLPGLPHEAYVGEYQSPIYGRLVVQKRQQGIVISLGATGQCIIQARHTTMHSFVGDWSALDPDDPDYHFDFIVSPSGTVEAVTLREFDIRFAAQPQPVQ